MKTVEEYKNAILKGGYKRICNVIGTIKLREGDQIRFLGEENYTNYKVAALEILEEHYKDDKLYKYYIEFDKEVDGWCDFERWLIINNY